MQAIPEQSASSRTSIDSFDFDEDGKGMLQRLDSLDYQRRRSAAAAEFRKQPLRSTNPSSARRRLGAMLLPASVVANALLFALALFVLAHPCSFSARECVYRVKGEDAVGGEGKVEETGGGAGDGGSSGLKLLGEVNGLVPEFGFEKVMFMNDSRYSNEQMFSDARTYDKILRKWEEDMPLGRGFVTVPAASVHLLPRPYHISANPTANGYSIASLHQFHCIYMIMRAHGNVRFNRTEHRDPEDFERHVTHCFDYLRQSSQCAGDAALEGKSESVEGMTDGWGNVHVCKKNSELVGWVLDRRLSNHTGIH